MQRADGRGAAGVGGGDQLHGGGIGAGADLGDDQARCRQQPERSSVAALARVDDLRGVAGGAGRRVHHGPGLGGTGQSLGPVHPGEPARDAGTDDLLQLVVLGQRLVGRAVEGNVDLMSEALGRARGLGFSAASLAAPRTWRSGAAIRHSLSDPLAPV